MSAEVKLPEELIHPYFFPESKLVLGENGDEKIFIPFLDEATYYLKLNKHKPWSHPDESISNLLREWETLKIELDTIFKNRERHASGHPMKKGIALFIQFFFWSNGIPVMLHPQIKYEKMVLKPVNVEERLNFLLAKPNLYHSYIQLKELMVEMEKQFVKRKAIQKK